ncbi:MAG: hypothetical protein C0623_03560 [Desulfuromonas sp.]|nr:MAG: hypothetical protein C0623_03560 [Desulfuromonas sp.]
MKNHLFVTSLLIIMLTLTPVITHAGQAAQDLAVCLTDSINGKERKNLAKWIYFGMSTHSTIKPYTKATQKDFDGMNKYVGGLITRLMTEDCPQTANAAFKEGGTSSIQYAFGIVGEVAMQELMTEPSVSQALGAFEKYLDQDKFDQTFQ